MESQQKCTFTWEERGVIVRFEGSYTMEQIMKEHERFVGNEKFDDLLYTIVDLSAANLESVVTKDTLSLVAADFGASMSLPDNLLAIVASHPDTVQLFQFYVDQMESVGATWKIAIHESVDAAREWIGRQQKERKIRNMTPHPFDTD